MPQASIQKFISVLLLVFILAVSIVSPGQASLAAGKSGAAQLQKFIPEGSSEDHCPTCPDSDHSDPDHNTCSCNCSNHPPILGMSVRIEHSPVIADLVFYEPFTALPEVYLPKFIPPQKAA